MSHRFLSYTIATLLVATSADAHPFDVSQSEWTVDGNIVHGHVEVAVRDLGGQALRELLERKTQVDLGGPCSVPIIELDEPKGDDGQAIDARFDCPGPGGALGVRLLWLDDMPAEHRHVAHLTYGATGLTAMLTKENKATSLAAPAPKPTPPPAPTRWPWIAAGAALIAVLAAIRFRKR